MTTEYRVLTYADQVGNAVAGVLVGDNIYRAQGLLSGLSQKDTSSVLDLLRDWERVKSAIGDAMKSCDGIESVSLQSTRLLAPVLYPGAVFTAAANYYDHMEEMAEVSRQLTGKRPDIVKSAEPYITLKTSADSIIGTNASIRCPAFTHKLDWEAEIAVVMGSECKNVSAANAMQAVAGYTIVNDLSARDLMKREGLPFIFDWFGQKCFTSALPMGPWITPKEFVSDPHNLTIKLWVNDQLKQDGTSRSMMHSIDELVAYVSRHITLRPGDVIATGCPAGVGMIRNEFLKHGDRVRIEVEGLGTLVNDVMADVASDHD